MDNRDDHGKNHTSGNDGHGVHICHKCGWPFPNPHPSARHRRAHKKICGTIDGYKLVESRDSALSDDEHLPDEDHKTPGLEKRNDEIMRAGSGDRSNRSEDEAFVDAVTEFSDSGSGKGIESSSDGVMKRARSIGTSLTDNTKTALSFEDDPVTVVVPPSENSAYTSQDTESQGNTLSADALDSENQPSHVLVGSMGRPITDYRVEESGHESVDVKNSSECDPNPIQLESQGNLSQEKLKKRAREDLAVLDVTGNQDYNKRHNTFDDSIETDTKGKEKEIKTFEAVPVSGKTEDVASDHVAAAGVVESNNQRDDGLDSKKSLDVPSSEVGSISSTQITFDDSIETDTKGKEKEIKTFEAVPVSGKTEDVASDHVAAAGVVESVNQRDDGLDSKKSLDVPSSEVGSISSTQINELNAGEMSSEGLTEIITETGELNDNFHVLSVPGDIPVLENAEIMIEGYKDHRGGRMPQFVEVDSFEVTNNFRDSVDKVNPSNSFSKLSDEGEKELFASGTDISKDSIPQEAGNSEHVIVNSSSSSSLSDVGDQLFALETHVSSDSIDQEGGNRENVVEKPHNETEPGESQLKESSQKHDESFVIHHAAANEVEKPDEQLTDNYHHSLSESISFEHDGATAPVPPSVNAELREASELVSKDDAADFEISRSDITNSKEAKAVAEDSSFGKMTATPEDLGIRSEGVVPESNDFSEDKYVSDTGNGKAAGSYGSEIEIRSGDLSLGPVDECNLVNTAGRPEIAEDLHETLVSSKDVTLSGINMSEPKLVLLNEASDSQEHGTNDKGEKLEGDTTTIAGEKEGFLKSSSNAGDVPMLKDPSGKIDDFEASQESREEQRTKESQLSPSIQNSSTISDGAARDPGEAGPEYGTGEGENRLVAQQLGASATDADFEISRSDITNSKEAKAVAEDSSFGKMTETPEDLGIRSEGVVPESNDFSEDKYVSDTGNGKAAGSYGSEIEIRSGDLSLGPVDECNLVITAWRPEIAEDLHETLVSSKDVTSSGINMSEPKLVLLNEASDSQEHGTNDKGEKLEGDTTTIAGEKEGLLKSSSNAGDVPMLKDPSGKIDDFEASQESQEEQRTKESQLSPSIQNSSTISDGAARDPGEAGPEYGTGEGENRLVAQQLGASATDVSVDSGSRTDSLEGHWGSVSVLSAQSDKPAAVDIEKADAKKPKAATEETEKQDMVEPPSFMTLVEPRDGDNKAAEIQTAKAGWFPSISNVVNESQGRKKNEEMIAKVTNWSTAKQHAPLKNLLSETETESENKPKQDEPKPAAASNEWNSPARYPADIKREKRRPYWAQFMCCTSAK